MGRIADESIQQVIATVNIVDVISAYFPLKRAGVNFTACCPFHTERTPSFSVSPAKNLFHCFGCGKGGTVITFVMEYESLPYVDAVRKLAGKYGITLIEEAGTAESEEKTPLRVRLLALHRDIAEWFHQMLLRSPLAQDARAYLKKRGPGIGRGEGLEHSRVLACPAEALGRRRMLCMSANPFRSDWAQVEAGTFRFPDPPYWSPFRISQ